MYICAYFCEYLKGTVQRELREVENLAQKIRTGKYFSSASFIYDI
jgi:hypothetical protein